MRKRPGYSYEQITKRDLLRLLEIARADRNEFFSRWPHPKSYRYRSRVLCTALCQGAALRYVDGENGIKDFDAYTFFAALPGTRFPSRRHVQVDFGPSRFGRWGREHRFFVGRHVDLLWRALPVRPVAHPPEAVRSWLQTSRNKSPRKLREKAVVMLEPGIEIVWPLD